MKEHSNDSPFQAVDLSVSLTVADLARSLFWYHDVVGFSIDQQHEREGRLTAVSLRAGNVRILLGQDDGAKGEDREKGAGFSLMITTEQDLDALARRIRDRGAALENEPVDTPWGQRMFRLRDPDGFRYTIASPKPAPARG